MRLDSQVRRVSPELLNPSGTRSDLGTLLPMRDPGSARALSAPGANPILGKAQDHGATKPRVHSQNPEHPHPNVQSIYGIHPSAHELVARLHILWRQPRAVLGRLHHGLQISLIPKAHLRNISSKLMLIISSGVWR